MNVRVTDFWHKKLSLSFFTVWLMVSCWQKWVKCFEELNFPCYEVNSHNKDNIKEVGCSFFFKKMLNLCGTWWIELLRALCFSSLINLFLLFFWISLWIFCELEFVSWRCVILIILRQWCWLEFPMWANPQWQTLCIKLDVSVLQVAFFLIILLTTASFGWFCVIKGYDWSFFLGMLLIFSREGKAKACCCEPFAWRDKGYQQL